MVENHIRRMNMARKAKELSALVVGRLTAPGHHAVGGVTGLYLYVNDSGAKSWVLRFVIGTKRRHMGLGSFADISLAQAREKARAARADISDGIDPIAQRIRQIETIRAQHAALKTFKQATEGYLDAHSDSWKNQKHRAQWKSTLQTYAYPVLGDLSVGDADVAQTHVLKVLEPIWKTKNETASRVRGRIETVLDWATVRRYRSGDNPARWKGHLDKLLPAPSKVKKVEHHKALPIKDMPRFMEQLRKHEGVSARALEFTILCASRSGEVRGAVWSEIDLDSKVWIIPAERMKGKREHRVPLTETAIALLKNLPCVDESTLVFASPRGGQLSDMALTAVIRRMKVDAVPHGFRSTFRDWAGECTNYPREIAEQALAHALESKVEAAYRRGDALEKRRTMMNDWCKFISTQHSKNP